MFYPSSNYTKILHKIRQYRFNFTLIRIGGWLVIVNHSNSMASVVSFFHLIKYQYSYSHNKSLFL